MEYWSFGLLGSAILHHSYNPSLHVLSALGKVSVNLFTMQKTHEENRVILKPQSEAIIADLDAKVIASASKLFDVFD